MDVTVGQELAPFVREAGFPAWNRYAAVNDEFIPIHMDDAAGQGGRVLRARSAWATCSGRTCTACCASGSPAPAVGS